MKLNIFTRIDQSSRVHRPNHGQHSIQAKTYNGAHSSTHNTKSIIGRVEALIFAESNIINLPAKVDTGAYRSSVWATEVYEKNSMLYYKLLGPQSAYYNGQELQTAEYKLVEVENSFGHKQMRYSIFLKVKICGKTIRSNFTLANRAEKTYAVLIGRKMLKNRFIVDVSTGSAVADEEVNRDDSLE